MASEKLLAEVMGKYENAYRKRTPKSRATVEMAKKYMPGGETRRATFFWPYPIWIEQASGCRFTDLDDNEYIDFHNCYTTMVLGHANPTVTEAVRQQIVKGTAHAALTPIVTRWAELICQRVASIDKIRFTNSGTEAVMMAIRAARGFTRKDKIITIEQAYHGSYDPIVYPPDTAGLPKSVLVDSITVPYNDKEAAERAVVENKDQLAAMVVEGILGSAGQVPPKEGYLSFLREVTAANNVLLILDEVQSFRLDYHGGMQHIFGIKPDLTTLGKTIGGGYPVGAFGGKEEIMKLFSPEVNKIYHSGTLNANPVTATAGVATLEQLTVEEIARINKLGESLAEGMRRVFVKLNIKGQATGWGSLQNLHFSPVPIVDGKTAYEANKNISHLLHLALMERGIFSSERGLFNISTPMAEREINMAIKAIDNSLSEMLPYIEQIWPELVGVPVSV